MNISIKKEEINFEVIEKLLDDKNSQINCLYILMDIKPYRKNIFLQLYGKKNEFDKLKWKKYDLKEKMEWISINIYYKWGISEIKEHILKAIYMFSDNQVILHSFMVALQIDLQKGVIKNV